MKNPIVFATILFLAVGCQAQPTLQQHLQPGSPQAGSSSSVAPAKDPANYRIRVEWTREKGDSQFPEVLTTEGPFTLDTIQKSSVKINNSDIPSTLKFSGTLTELSDDKGQLQLFLGRTVPYVTSTFGSGPNASSSYSQLSVGLDSTFIVHFGKPIVIQTDENGQISILVKRLDD